MTAQTYDNMDPQEWLNGLKEMDVHNTRHILSALALLGIPKSYFDVGCGTGVMVKVAEKLGLEAYGVDQLVDETWPKNFFHKNLSERFVLPSGPVELVTSFEVAEHIEEQYHEMFCDTVAYHVAPGHHFLLFSAARPGQAGTGHVACRPAEYWHQEMIKRGLSYNGSITMNLALVWSNIGSPLNYMWDNLMVFERG